jgi:hypothetical protein
MNLSKLFFGCIVFALSNSVFAQEGTTQSVESTTTRQALTRLTNQIRIFPQEKVYLQLDKPYYSAGDRVWLRAHMVHAALHIPLSLSRYIYVELIDSKNEVVIRKKIHYVDKNSYYGQFDLSPEIADGWYSIRAYTNFMQNLPEDFFFRRQLLITNRLKNDSKKDKESLEPAAKDVVPSKAAKASYSYDVQFFPEGGHLIAGNQQTVGFKAIAQNGLGLDVKGKVLDAAGLEVATFISSHLGMGSFSFVPKADKRYTVVCEDENGKKATYDLPTVSTTNYALSVRQNLTQINVQILVPEQSKRTEKLHIIGTLRGLPFSQNTLTPEENFLTIPKTNLQSGIAQLYLINDAYQILSQRIIFVSSRDDAKLEFKFNKTNYQKRDSVHAKLVLKNSSGIPIAGSFSISVTDDNDIRQDSNEINIKSYMLLQSELTGTIENPGSYFYSNSKNADADLDVLMLTQGWKRYDTQATLLGNYTKCDAYEVEQGPIITGKVRNYSFKRALPNINVSLFASKKSFFDGVLTDKSGDFLFKIPDYPDSISYRVEAKQKELQMIELIVNKDTFPKVTRTINFPKTTQTSPQLQSFIKKSRDKWFLENGMLSVTLKNVEVVGRRVDKNNDLRKQRGSIYSDPGYSIDDEAVRGANTIYDAMSLIPGLMINSTNDGVLYRNEEPLVIVDKMEYSMAELVNIRVDEIKMIDFLKEPTQTALFGTGNNIGVIYIYLKTGEDYRNEPPLLGTNQTFVMPLGYTQPAAFYMPKYQVPSIKKDQTPDLRTTIFWKPNVKCDENGEAECSFYTADANGTYTITAEGITPSGEIIRYQGKINRK